MSPIMRTLFWPVLLLLIVLTNPCGAAGDPAAFTRFADQFTKEYLAWRPADGVALGLHEYDGRITDFSRRSVEGEMTRLRKAERTLALIDSREFDAPTRCDYELLRSAVRKERFRFEVLKSFSRNPMTYARSIDVNI